MLISSGERNFQWYAVIISSINEEYIKLDIVVQWYQPKPGSST
jgi:hypothetical protein